MWEKLASSSHRLRRKHLSNVRQCQKVLAAVKGGGVDLTYPLLPVPPASVLGCLWKYQASRETVVVCVCDLFDWRVRKSGYLPVPKSEVLNPPWRL